MGIIAYGKPVILILGSLTCLVNGLIIEKIPKELDCLNTLELVLISKRPIIKRLLLCLKGKHQKCMVQ